MVDAYHPKEPPYQMQLLRFHSSCHGNWVTIMVRYVADAHPEEPPYQI